MMKCGPPEQAVIPSIAHSGGKVKGGGGPGRGGREKNGIERGTREGRDLFPFPNCYFAPGVRLG